MQLKVTEETFCVLKKVVRKLLLNLGSFGHAISSYVVANCPPCVITVDAIDVAMRGQHLSDNTSFTSCTHITVPVISLSKMRSL